MTGSALTPQGSTRRWRRLRRLVLERDRYRCQLCGAQASHVDHVRPRVMGGTDELDNLRALCAGCNLARGADDRGTGRAPRRRWSW